MPRPLPWQRDSTLRRLRDEGHHPAPFRDKVTTRWVAGGGLTLLALALMPFVWPALSVWTQRFATLASMVFLVAAVALAFGLRARAFVVAAALVALLYAAAAFTSFAFLAVHDFFLLAVLVGFGVFALAGFNLVFVLEEMVYDAHRLLHPRGRLWKAALPAVGTALALGLPWWHARGGPWNGAVWGAGVAVTVLLGGWWFLRLVNDLPEEPVLQELHMFSLGILGATAIAASLQALGDLGTRFLTSIIAYALLLGTWMYVSYTSLQRTHFLLRGRNTLPWVSLLLGASFAILAHAQVNFQAVGEPGVAQLLARRVDFLLAGVWIGLAFYVVRNVWVGLRHLRDMGAMGATGRVAAGRAARVAEELLVTEQRVTRAVGSVLWGLERRLPGHLPAPRGWDLDPERLALEPIEEE